MGVRRSKIKVDYFPGFAETELADEIEKSAGAIRRHVERELARARLAPGVSGKASCRVREAAAGVIAVIKRTPGGKQLSFLIDVAEDFVAPVEEGDLSEILGNLVENAARFARSSVQVNAWASEGEVSIAVADDGPGIPNADRESALSRKARMSADSTCSGVLRPCARSVARDRARARAFSCASSRRLISSASGCTSLGAATSSRAVRCAITFRTATLRFSSGARPTVIWMKKAAMRAAASRTSAGTRSRTYSRTDTVTL
ncbi:ATP-binding protein [Mesorhizobium huakuii]|uniref:ATP-binding protein n=1 Tax=Mesorhizobium huakuii TaxID=28104 RepID=UPI001FD38653|nr:ATP-binding protein [Mesorhizobium huakuii]